MNIYWYLAERVFAAEFSQDFAGDLDAVKTAGFRTFGPPAWIWYAPSPGIKALNRLREKRPASGLTITPEALEIYKPLAEIEAKNAVVRKQAADFKKKVKKEKQKEEVPLTLPEGKMSIGVEDLSPRAPFVMESVAEFLGEKKLCISCHQRVYFYEQQEPPLCLWCEMNAQLSPTVQG